MSPCVANVCEGMQMRGRSIANRAPCVSVCARFAKDIIAQTESSGG
ncbi:hypothetical protein EPIB2_802 [Tritonibacter mobilis]|nr:hypothetical protein EPIB2_802 [Tritonibacter mobilis]